MAGLSLETGTKNRLLLLELKGKPLLKTNANTAVDDELRLGASASPTASGDYGGPPAPPPPPPPPASTSSSGDFTHSGTIIRHDIGTDCLVRTYRFTRMEGF